MNTDYQEANGVASGNGRIPPAQNTEAAISRPKAMQPLTIEQLVTLLDDCASAGPIGTPAIAAWLLPRLNLPASVPTEISHLWEVGSNAAFACGCTPRDSGHFTTVVDSVTCLACLRIAATTWRQRSA